MKSLGNAVLGALIMLVGLVILTESKDNHIDIKIADNKFYDVGNAKKVVLCNDSN